MYGDWISIVFRAAPIASRYCSLMLLAPDIGLLHTTIERAPVGRGGNSRIERRRRQAAGFDPVLVERAFERADGGTGDLEMRIPPVLLVLRVAEPVVGDAHAAGERDVAVDDERLAMGPIVGVFEAEEAERIEPRQLGAGGLSSRSRALRLQRRPDRIEDDADDDAALGGARQGVDEAIADLAVVEHVGFEVDARPGGVDRRQHRRERLVAVVQDGVGIAACDRRADERRDVVRKARIGGRDRTLDPQRLGILREEQQEADEAEAKARSTVSALRMLPPRLLPADRSRLIVVASSAPTCPRSYG